MTSYAAQRAELLLGCYRTGDANDPEVYVAAITAILARYPEQVITAVTHPASGLPSKKSWLPTVKEVCDACDEAVEPIVQHEARLKRIKEQLEMRERMDAGEKPTLEQLQEKYGKGWGILPPDEGPKSNFRAPSGAELLAHYREYNLEFEPKTTVATET